MTPIMTPVFVTAVLYITGRLLQSRARISIVLYTRTMRWRVHFLYCLEEWEPEVQASDYRQQGEVRTGYVHDVL
ncbi:hypothetical protein EDD16DRAFT_1608940 [Pisolithus croceorrhizus]|nr:hypothetical protein EDD16DRAFT_1608940 [Pisolithus croceorrhizus]